MSTLRANYIESLEGIIKEVASLSTNINPEAFGAVGDGVSDDYQAIVDMLNYANGRKCLSPDGAVYRVSQPIDYSGNVHWVSEGISEIFYDGQINARLVKFSGNESHSTTLSSSIEINARDWVLSDASSVEVGMLMEVMSSESWYHDPRPGSTDARKSELHKVVSVSGNTVTTELPANDGYDLTGESVSVTFYNPINVYLKGIKARAIQLAYGETSTAMGGIRIETSIDGKIVDCGTKDTQASGLSLVRCYNTHTIRGRYEGANYYFTGYGVQTSGSTLCWVFGTKHWECRRGVDVSGGNIISLHTYVKDCTATGGGYNSRGDVYGWDDSGGLGAASFGFGTHGPSDKCVFEGNVVSRVHTPFNSRGRNTHFLNNKVYGRTRGGAFVLTYGTNCVIQGNVVDPSFFGGKDTNTYGGANINSRLADSLLTIGSTWQSDPSNPVIIKDNTVTCWDNIVILNTTVSRLVYSGNTVNSRPLSGSTETYLFFNDTGSHMNTGDWYIDVGSVYKSGDNWKVYSPLMNADQETVINGEFGRFTPIVTGIIGNNNPAPAQEDLWYEVQNGYVHVYGRINLDVSATSGYITARVDGLPYPRSFISSLQASGLASGLWSGGQVSARTDGDANRLFVSVSNLEGVTGENYIRIDAYYSFKDSVPFS